MTLVTTQVPRRGGQGRHTSLVQNLTGGRPAKIPSSQHNCGGPEILVCQQTEADECVPAQHGTVAVDHHKGWLRSEREGARREWY